MRYLIKQSTTMHLVISGSGLMLPQRFETPEVTVRGLLSSLQLYWNSADWRIVSNILLGQSSPLCFCCLWSHGIITSFVSDSQICCCYCIATVSVVWSHICCIPAVAQEFISACLIISLGFNCCFSLLTQWIIPSFPRMIDISREEHWLLELHLLMKSSL